MADPPEMSENVDLDPERKRYILDMYARLASLDLYQVLGVARDADKKAVKRAYFGLAATMHPDRYFGKNLGSYKAKMAAVFARISTAYETLSDTTKREAYDARLPSRSAAGGKAPVDPTIAAQRQAAMDALKQRFADGKAKAKQHVEAAVRARAAGDYLGAAEAYKLALAVTPNDPEIKAAYEEMQKASSEKLVEANKKKAMLEERFGRWSEAAEAWRRVLAIHPHDAEALNHLAQALARGTAGG